MEYRRYFHKKNDGCLPMIISIGCTYLIYHYEKFTTLPIQKFILAHNKLWAKYFWQYTHFNDHFGGTLVGAVVLTYLIYQFFCFVDNQIWKFRENQKTARNKKSAFVWLGGISTGELLQQGHQGGLAPNQFIFLGLEDCCLNFVAFGGIGSGKTSRLILPLVYCLTRNYQGKELGGLVFDVKGDFGFQFKETAKPETKIIKVGVSPDALGFNLLDGLTPELASSYLNSALLLGNGANDKFWVDSATQLIKNVLGILQHCDNAYNLQATYKFIFDDQYAAEKKREAAANALAGGNEIEMAKVNNCMDYLQKIYGTFDEKVQQSIKATVSTVLEPFQAPELASKFCDSSAETVSIYKILDGNFLLVDLPLAVWGMGAKVIYTLIKLRFFSMVQERVVNSNLNQDIPCVFICDEYQDVISVSRSGLSDLSFWDKSRSAKCIGIISSQSVSSFRAACHDRDLADTVLQNFRQKFCFRTEDLATIDYFQRLAGDTEHRRVVESCGRSGGQASSGWSEQYYKENVITPQLMRGLNSNYVVAFMNISGQSYDDVIYMHPYYELVKT